MHGVSVIDPYRWLEDQDSPCTREWLAGQRHYSRTYLDAIPGRDPIRERLRELLDVETYDSLQAVGNRYFFRKRLPGQEQPCLYFREGWDGPDQLLVDPAQRGTGRYTSVKPCRISPDLRWLLYEVKEGGERTGRFELLNLETRQTLPESLPRGYLRGFAFAPEERSFYYVHESVHGFSTVRKSNTVYRHVLGTSVDCDQEIFSVAGSEKLRLHIVPGSGQIGFLVFRFLKKTLTDFYLWPVATVGIAAPVIRGAEYRFGPILLHDGRILAITDHLAPNFRIVELRLGRGSEAVFTDLIPQSEWPIQNWAACGGRIFVSYLRRLRTDVDVFDLSGERLGQVPLDDSNTVRLLGGPEVGEQLLLEEESFTNPPRISSYSTATCQLRRWAERKVPFEREKIDHVQVWYPGKDGTSIPIFLVGRSDVLNRSGGASPTIMTAYGGYGIPTTPQFSVLVAFLMERGCLFALPQIRGGSELGIEWHNAGRRRNRQLAFDDFLSAAEWLIATGRTAQRKLAIVGGSNSGLLVGAAMTQRPDLFQAVLCIAPLLDMLRYDLFDNAHVWRDELGTSEDPDDFRALLGYSPYHNVREGTHYPATMIVSGDRDQNCNPLHARKMTARLQAANVSGAPILIEYSEYRGHSPVLPLSERIEALTDRLAFLCEQLQLTM
jgi:prolyl oligopeptidase